MHNTCWFLSEMDRSKHTRLYESEENHTKLKSIDLYGLTTYPDGGVRTTVADLSHYLIWIMNRGQFKETRILKKATVTEMLTPDYTDSYTKFWSIDDWIGHGGEDPGVSTGMYFSPIDKLGIIIFINTNAYGTFEKKEEKIFEFGKLILLSRNKTKM